MDKTQFKQEIKFCKFFLIYLCIVCGTSAYINRNDSDALIGIVIFFVVFGGITLEALIVRIKYLKNKKSDF